MERLAMDILSMPYETENGNTCVLVVSDYFTKWTEAFALPDHRAQTVAEVLVTQVFLRLGTPLILHSDQGPEFRSELMKNLCWLLDVKMTKTAPYHPRSDGQVERFNRTLLAMLSKLCDERIEDWDDHLPYVMCAYRSTLNDSTGSTPNRMMLGRETRMPIDLIMPDLDVEGPYRCPVEYVEWVSEAMRENYSRAREHLGKVAIRQKRYFDKRASPRSFRVGDWVLRLYPPNVSHNKLGFNYTGPFLVLKQVGEVSYLIQREQSSSPITVHVDDLKPYKCQNPPSNWTTQVDTESDTQDREERRANPLTPREGDADPPSPIPTSVEPPSEPVQPGTRPIREKKAPTRYGWD